MVLVAADDDNIDAAIGFGFEWVEMPNEPLGAKWNSLYELAASEGMDFLIPLGSDDWIDAAFVLAQLEQDGEMRCTRRSAVVREDGKWLARLRIPYDGGDGVRIIPTALLEPFGYRPCDDTANRAIDTTTLRRLSVLLGRQPQMSYMDDFPLGVVDFKSPDNLNGYAQCQMYRDGAELDPWEALAGLYPTDSIAEIRGLYAGSPAPPPYVRPAVPAPGTLNITVTRESLEALRAIQVTRR